MPIHYLETGSVDPCYNLALEQYVLEHRREGDWLMLWQNRNTVVVGLNQNTAEEINASFVEEHGITVVRRMTGGGAVYHEEELTIGRFTEPVCRALASLGVQASTSGRNDILVDGKKISGVAQRIVKGRILHHGTLLFDSDPAMIAGALRVDPAKFTSKSAKSVRSRVGNLHDYLPGEIDLPRFRDLLLRELTRDGLIRESLSPDELQEVRTLADEKYRSWDWTYGRSPDSQYHSRQRFPGGTLEVSMNLHAGRIEEISFFGDFMATAPLDGLTDALRGVMRDAESLTEVLERFDLPSLFGGIQKEEILSLLLDEDP